MSSKEIAGLISDFDNTLVKTRSFIHMHLAHTCERLGIEAPTNNRIDEILKSNPPFEEIFNTLFGEKASQVLSAYRQDALNTPYQPMDGALKLIDTLQQRGAKIVIVSNRTNKLPERLSQASFNPEDFIAIIQPTDPKPSKNAYNEAIELLEKNGVPRQKIYILGDSPDDFLACPSDLSPNFYALTSGGISKDDFLGLGLSDSQILDSPEKLLEKIQ